MQRTLVLVKPDAVQRGLAGQVITRLERRGLKLAAMKMMLVTEELARRHYSALREKPFFPRLVDFITSSPIVAMVVEGENAVELVRNTMGGDRSSAGGAGDHPGRSRHVYRPEPDPRVGLGRVGTKGDRPVLRPVGDSLLRQGGRPLDH